PSSILLAIMRGCHEGRPLKSRMRAQTFSTGASMTLEIMTLAILGGSLSICRSCKLGQLSPACLSMRLAHLSMRLKKRRTGVRSSGDHARRFAVERRRNADMVAEEAREIALRGEAEIAGDRNQRRLRALQLAHRLLHAQRVPVDVRGQIGLFLEQGEEMRPRQADGAGNLVEADAFAHIRFHQMDGLADAK